MPVRKVGQTVIFIYRMSQYFHFPFFAAKLTDLWLELFCE